MTRPNGRALVDFAVAVERADEHGLRVAMGYLIGASAHSVAVRRALNGAIDAIATDRAHRSDTPAGSDPR
jgi:hypothetical protein